MSNKLKNGLFIFRRDLRIVDNNGLNMLSSLCDNIYTIFIFTPEQVGSRNEYKSDNAVQFMIESLENLSSEIKKQGGHLYTFYGKNNKVIMDCINKFDIDVVGFNIDVTPYAQERDNDILKMCEHLNVAVSQTHDYFLHEPGSIKTGSGDPYQKFTPYYTTASKIKVQQPTNKKQLPLKNKHIDISNKITLTEAMNKFIKNPNKDILVHGGRQEAIKILKSAIKNIKNYDAIHNDLTKQTTQLSASIKFGCLSIREIYEAFRNKSGLIRQLYWRDFYANIMYEFPYVLGHSLKSKYDKIQWRYNDKWFNAWCKGETGFPIVDAGMRQMNTTGYMHNRSRLIVASFLVKTLLIDWREGEKYFAQTLTDYDVPNNNGNWQWISGGGADSQMYNRIFNPSRQGEQWDPECEYIKKWVPELSSLEPKIIHNWENEYVNYKNIDYPKPIVDYAEQREKALKMYTKGLY